MPDSHCFVCFSVKYLPSKSSVKIIVGIPAIAIVITVLIQEACWGPNNKHSAIFQLGPTPPYFE